MRIKKGHIGIVEKAKQAWIVICITLCACAIAVLHEQSWNTGKHLHHR